MDYECWPDHPTLRDLFYNTLRQQHIRLATCGWWVRTIPEKCRSTTNDNHYEQTRTIRLTAGLSVMTSDPLEGHTCWTDQPVVYRQSIVPSLLCKHASTHEDVYWLAIRDMVVELAKDLAPRLIVLSTFGHERYKGRVDIEAFEGGSVAHLRQPAGAGVADRQVFYPPQGHR
jgi:hypothetical protein